MPEDIKEQKEVEQQQEEAEEKKEEVETKLQLTKELAQQTAAFGIYLNLQVTWAAARSLPWGLAAAGAAATRTIVDAGDVKGAARMTVLLVKLGFLDLVRDIVAKLAQQDRSDVVSQVTMAMLNMGEFATGAKINNALITKGYSKESAAIAGVLGSQVSHKLFDKLKHAGANLTEKLWPGHHGDHHDDHHQDAQSPADSNATGESNLGLEGMAADSKHPIMSY